jgi:ABC-type proline/glycine betaine transport system substrate-binding protein
MIIKIHPHARTRMQERGASEDEVIETIKTGEKFPAKFGRIGFRRNFNFEGMWRGKKYNTKQVEAYAVKENDDFVVITVIVKYF